MSEQPVLPEQPEIDMSYQAPAEEDFIDYFSGFGRTEKFIFPDGIQYIEFQLLNEGQKAKFQKGTRSAISIDRKTDKASVMPDPSRERHELIKTSLCDWLLYTRHKQNNKKTQVVFNQVNLDAWLKNADPQIVENLEKEIRKANPWMLDDITVEDIDNQIIELQELREEKERIEAEKSGS